MSQTVIKAGRMNVSLVNRLTGDLLPIYTREGRYYVKAVSGLQYTIRTSVAEPGRFEVLAGIDGRDTLVNAPADLVMSSGMVIHGYSQYEIPGWGVNDTTPFIFTVYDRATMAVRKTGSARNLGVIAVAYFNERPRPQSILRGPVNFGVGEDDFTAKGGATFGLESFRSPTRGAGMGTGTNDNDVTHRDLGTTQFTRANMSTPNGLVEIYAMPEWWLVEEGILPERPVHDRNHPAGFNNQTKPRGDY